MAKTFRHVHPFFLALTAMAAVLFGAKSATACESLAERKAGCVSACECCSAVQPGSSVEQAVLSSARSDPAGAGVVLPTNLCYCCTGERSSPATNPDRRAAERRSDVGRALSAVELPRPLSSDRPVSPAILPTASPSKSPLYLRHARLLI